MSGQQQIASTISHFYDDLFMEPSFDRPRLEGLVFNGIATEKALILERPVSEKEVLEALKSLQEEKALGLDGFPMRFVAEL